MKNKTCKIYGVLSGLFIGSVNGLFGGGGGMIAVPTLINVFKTEEKIAHATAIAIILPISVISAIIYGFNGYINTGVCLPVTFGAVIGGIIGALLLKKINGNVVKWIFGFLALISGIRCVV